MSTKQKTLVQYAIPVLLILGTIGGVWVSMSMDAAVLGEQIRTVTNETHCLKAEDEKHEMQMHTVERQLGGRVGEVERDMAGLNASMKAIQDIAAGNAKKLDRLLEHKAYCVTVE
jgi:hypothetical protein